MRGLALLVGCVGIGLIAGRAAAGPLPVPAPDPALPVPLPPVPTLPDPVAPAPPDTSSSPSPAAPASAPTSAVDPTPVATGPFSTSSRQPAGSSSSHPSGPSGQANVRHLPASHSWITTFGTAANVRRAFERKPAAVGPAIEPNSSSATLGATVERAAQAIRPVLVALLALAILLLTVASLPNVAVADPRLANLLTRHRVDIAVVGGAALGAVMIAFLLG